MAGFVAFFPNLIFCGLFFVRLRDIGVRTQGPQVKKSRFEVSDRIVHSSTVDDNIEDMNVYNPQESVENPRMHLKRVTGIIYPPRWCSALHNDHSENLSSKVILASKF